MIERIGDKQKPCTYCTQYGHTAWKCPRKARMTLKTHKPMKKVGRVTRATNKAVREWKKTQQPNHQGYFKCYICHKWITYLEAEHVRSKARHPDQRTDLTNLKPVCANCNEKKGSKDN